MLILIAAKYYGTNREQKRTLGTVIPLRNTLSIRQIIHHVFIYLHDVRRISTSFIIPIRGTFLQVEE